MQIANGTLVMVVDGAKLLLFKNDGNAKLPALSTLAHEKIDNPATRDQGSDTPGRSFSSVGNGRSSLGETDWHQQNEDRFAAHAADTLDRAATGGDGIIVIAPPRTLGELRKRYGAKTTKQLLAEIPKDLAGHVTDDIVKAITAYEP
ncbi:host attachment family protein [Novosphingobium sp. KCTC 2891]|uniref:host attachment family protein n=1 Tax=Novosphingobium sp. KCTC 2891 TaxID=2989730 RepID=UPI0022222F78|nr:host attachment family protein [Novosphingobium sp. KCTC 2891]MCW1382947.1 host attachment family protein [Novosphingobium sp. KCTC 2891]